MLRNEIIEWVKRQPYWGQLIANHILKGEQIISGVVDDIYSSFKQENNLVQQSSKKADLEFLTKSSSTDTSEKMKWSSISNLQGINAIDSRNPLHIGKQMTLIYGENGSGKSGYTRILNKAFVSRGDKKILPNIFNDDHVIPSAVFEFKNDRESKTIAFPQDKSSILFQTVAVFDSQSALHDLSEENELSFIPLEFNFFPKYSEIYLQIKDRLSQEIEQNKPNNDFINCFEKQTSVKKALEEITTETEYSKLESLSSISDMEDTFKTYSKEKMQLLALNSERQKQELNSFIDGLSDIKKNIETLNKKFSSERIFQTKDLLNSRDLLKKCSSTEGFTILEGEHIYNLGSLEWKKFIDAAHSYYNSIHENIDTCIFCGQDIENVSLIDKYWQYLKSDSEKKLAVAEQDLQKILINFQSQTFQLLVKESKLDEWLQKNQNDAYKKIISAEQYFFDVNKQIINNIKTSSWSDNIHPFDLDTHFITSSIQFIRTHIKDLNVDVVEGKLKTINTFLDEYNDRLKLKSLLPKVKDFMLKQAWCAKATQINFSTRNITLIQKSLFSTYVTSKYIDKFNLECKRLNSNFSAEVVQRGTKGVTLSKLAIKGRKPVEILSEGEQRSISLANFLAETSLSEDNDCIVFDDPVSSLDHKRREIIAQRLVDESKLKQVVILTHDVSFLFLLQNYCSSESIDCQITTIRKFKSSSGVIQEGKLPWIAMPVKKRIGFLRVELQELTSLYREMDNPDSLDKYVKQSKDWCESLRETWEHTIEEVLLNNAVQRFNPAIQTQRLKNATYTQSLYQTVEKGMRDCSDWVHDRAAALGEGYPTPPMLTGYLDICEKFVKDNRPY